MFKLESITNKTRGKLYDLVIIVVFQNIHISFHLRDSAMEDQLEYLDNPIEIINCIVVVSWDEKREVSLK